MKANFCLSCILSVNDKVVKELVALQDLLEVVELPVQFVELVLQLVGACLGRQALLVVHLDVDLELVDLALMHASVRAEAMLEIHAARLGQLPLLAHLVHVLHEVDELRHQRLCVDDILDLVEQLVDCVSCLISDVTVIGLLSSPILSVVIAVMSPPLLLLLLLDGQVGGASATALRAARRCV